MDQYHASIAAVLKNNQYDGKDVVVYIDRMLCGLWIWEERSGQHIHFDRAEFVDFLGKSPELFAWIHDLCIMETSWKFINPKRLKLANY